MHWFEESLEVYVHTHVDRYIHTWQVLLLECLYDRAGGDDNFYLTRCVDTNSHFLWFSMQGWCIIQSIAITFSCLVSLLFFGLLWFELVVFRAYKRKQGA